MTKHIFKRHDENTRVVYKNGKAVRVVQTMPKDMSPEAQEAYKNVVVLGFMSNGELVRHYYDSRHFKHYEPKPETPGKLEIVK